MRIPGGEPTPPTGKEVESPQEKAKRIFGEIMDKVQGDLGFSIKNPLLLKHDPGRFRIMALFDDILQRINTFRGASSDSFWKRVLTFEEDQEIQQLAQNLRLEPKSQIAACVAFLCHACSHLEVGADVKRDLGEYQDLKSIIQSIIRFFGENDNFVDPNVESIKIDDSYKVVIQLSPNSAKESSNPTKEYLLDW